MRKVTAYFRRVGTSAQVVIGEALAGVGWLDLMLVTVALAAIAGAVFETEGMAGLAKGDVGPKQWLGLWRGLNIALGLAILVNVRAIAPITKLAVAFTVLGLTGNIARNALPEGQPLTLSFAVINAGITLWFIGLHIRPSALERLAQANQKIDELTHALKDKEDRVAELEQHTASLEQRLAALEARLSSIPPAEQ